MTALPEFGAPDTLFVADLSGFVHRYFHAFPSNAGRRFHEKMHEVLLSRGPARFAIAEDNVWPTFRHDLAPKEYKANRSERGGAERAAVLEQLRIAGDMCEDLLGIRRFNVKGFEADDIIATLAAWGEEEGLRVVILGFDKDLTQAVSPRVTLWDGRDRVVGPEETVEWFARDEGEMALSISGPEQVADYLAMVGDKSDNIPGIWGVGPVAALRVLEEFGSLRKAIETAERGREAHPFWARPGHGKLWSRLSGARAIAETCLKLTRLRRDVPLGIDSLDVLRVEDG